jgi:hypothetical protein
MMVRLARLGAAVLGCAVVIVSFAAVASADPPDPHQPDLTQNYCPGGQWGFGHLAVCDGGKYPDGSYWHQWTCNSTQGCGFTYGTPHYDCVGGDEPLPAPPPPGGCA